MDPRSSAPRAAASASGEGALSRFLAAVGAPDVRTWLGVPPGATPAEATAALEARRREMEAALRDPARAAQADLFLELFDVIRDRLRRPPAREAGLSGVASGALGAGPGGAGQGRLRDARTIAPDYYDLLAVPEHASHAAIEAAWQRIRAAGRDEDPPLAQAWRVLGDPLNRAAYDRSRRAELEAARPPFEPDPVTDATPWDAPRPGNARARLSGTVPNEVVVDGDLPVAVPFVLVVEGSGMYRALVRADHPGLSVTAGDLVDHVQLPAGRHTLTLHVQPRLLGALPAAVTVSFVDQARTLHLALRVRQAASPASRQRQVRERIALALAGVGLLLVGWALGGGTEVRRDSASPTSVGRLDRQLPDVMRCFADGRSALPAYVDVHTDGFGRTTGFSFGDAVVGPAAHGCVRRALLALEFPPTADGGNAFHRYGLPARAP